MVRFILSFAVVMSVAAFAQTVEVKSKGKTVEVTGTKSGVKVKSSKGATTTVDAEGSDVTVEGATGAVNVKTTGNTVEISGVKGGTVDTASGLAVTDNGKTIEHTCREGENIGVMGNKNTITLHGPCRQLSVTGNKNTIIADVVDSIDALGNYNSVSWRSGPKGATPKIATLGRDNAVVQLR